MFQAGYSGAFLKYQLIKILKQEMWVWGYTNYYTRILSQNQLANYSQPTNQSAKHICVSMETRGTGVKGCCELSAMGAENWTWVPNNSTKDS